jgi:hypothetical protein
VRRSVGEVEEAEEEGREKMIGSFHNGVYSPYFSK